MWNKFKKYLSCTWALPLTLFGLFHVSFGAAMGWYCWHGTEGYAFVWYVNNDSIPAWLEKCWRRLSGYSLGQIIILKHSPKIKPIALKHELKHVDQMLCLGIFWPIFYYGIQVVIKLGCSDSDPYYDNPFEIDARRNAKQIVDIIGMTKKFIESKKL